MTKYLDPTNDVAFKKVFSDKNRLKKFLNCIMRLPPELQIKDLTYISQEMVPDLGQLKRGIVDIKCEDNSGNIYIVEMQNGWAENFLKRAQFYGAHAVTSQVQRGKTHAEIAPVVLVLLLSGYTPLQDEDLDVITFHRTIEVITGRQYLKDLSYVFVEVDRFKKKEDELETFEDYWLYYLSQWDRSQIPPKQVKDEDLLSAYEAINQFNWTQAELDEYLKVKLYVDTEKLNRKAEHAKGKAEGIAEGIERGKVEGIVEGIERGKAEGKIEGKIEVARSMLKEGLSTELVAKIAGLTIDEIKKLL